MNKTHEFNKLLNTKIDFEVDLYHFVLDKMMTSGIVFSCKSTKSFFEFVNHFDKIDLFSNVFQDKTLFHSLSSSYSFSREGLRHKILQPFFSKIFYKDDEIICSKEGTGSIRITLIKKGPTRLKEELVFFDSNEYINECILSFWSQIEHMINSDVNLNQRDVKILKSLKLVKSSDENYGFFKKDRKVIKSEVKERLINMVNQKDFPFQFSCVQEYGNVLNGHLGLFDMWSKSYDLNCVFWSQESIDQEKYDDNLHSFHFKN